MKLLFLGDSITDAYHCFDPQNLGDGYVRMIYEKLTLASEASHSQDATANLTVSNRGIDGFTLPRVYNLWQTLPDKSSWDAVSILVGINDVGSWMDCGRSASQIHSAILDFARIYEDLAADLLDQGIRRVFLLEPFLFPCPEKYRLWLPWVEELSSHIQAIARRYEDIFLPLQDSLTKAAQREGMSAITLDGIHLTERGNRIVAELWLEHFFPEHHPFR